MTDMPRWVLTDGDWQPWDHEAFERTLQRLVPGMSNAELGDYAAVSRETVRRLRQGDHQVPRVDLVERLAHVLGVEPKVEGWIRPLPRQPLRSWLARV